MISRKPDSNPIESGKIDGEFLNDILEGLGQNPRSLPSKYFYNEYGSQLFEKICELPEYYPTRTELAIMDRYLDEMVTQIGKQAILVEFGSGSSLKTRKLLAKLDDPVAYVPIDISEEMLLLSADAIRGLVPDCEILPVVADFTSEFALPATVRESSHAVVYFPGSTIGNFRPDDAIDMLRQFARLGGSQGGLLIGIDLIKEPAILEAAYNDAAGVTAKFNLNLLHRINQELGGDFDTDAFEHRAIFNPDKQRIEMHLFSLRDQVVRIGDQSFQFKEGESILTEYSHKYTVQGFEAIAATIGFELRCQWTDEQNWFAVLYFEQKSI